MAYPAKTDRDAILQTALSLVESEGVEGLSLRGVAAALDLAPNALYRYFADRAALESAITAQSARAMHAALAAATGRKKPANAVRALAKAYVTFAQERRHLYGMIMRPCTASAADAAAQVALWAFVVDAVRSVTGEARAREASIALWGLLHGMTSLDNAPVLGPTKSSGGLEFALNAWMLLAEAKR